MSYKIQQLGLGGILDQAISLVKNHFGLLFQIMLMTLIPWNFITGFIQLSVLTPLPPNSPPDVALKWLQDNWAVIYGPVVISVLVILPISNAATIYAVAQFYLGKNVSAWESVQYGVKRIVPLIWTGVLMFMAIMGGTMLCCVPGILCALWFGMAQEVVVLEDLSGVKALSRSKKLVGPYLGTFFVLGFLVLIITTLVMAGANFIPQKHVQLVVAILVNAVTTMFGIAVGVVFYFSCRCGVENFDLEHLAAAVGASVPSVSEVEEAS